MRDRLCGGCVCVTGGVYDRGRSCGPPEAPLLLPLVVDPSPLGDAKDAPVPPPLLLPYVCSWGARRAGGNRKAVTSVGADAPGGREMLSRSNVEGVRDSTAVIADCSPVVPSSPSPPPSPLPVSTLKLTFMIRMLSLLRAVLLEVDTAGEPEAAVVALAGRGSADSSGGRAVELADAAADS